MYKFSRQEVPQTSDDSIFASRICRVNCLGTLVDWHNDKQSSNIYEKHSSAKITQESQYICSKKGMNKTNIKKYFNFYKKNIYL